MTKGKPRSKTASIVLTACITAVVTLLLAGAAAYFLGYTGHPSKEMQAEQPAKKGKKILYWRAPMDPSYISDKPGKSPMGMDLVPVYEGEEAGGPPGMVRIDPIVVQNIGVTTMAVKRKRLTHDIRTIGRVVYDEEKVRWISPKIGGWIERQYVNFPGQAVEKGEKLLEIYSPELVTAQEEFLTTLHTAGTASGRGDLVESAEKRLRYWDITDAQIEALRRKGEVIKTMALYAPYQGIVVERNIPEGGFLKTGQMIYKIADISTVWVMAEVYEFETPWLRLGAEAEMSLAYQPGKTYSGKILYIYPYLKDKTRTLQVHMRFPNTPDFELKPGMWANVIIRSTIVDDGLAVPIQAVLRTGKRNIVLIALGEGRFAPREVVLGPQAGDEFQVLKGLMEGDRIVTSAQFLINSESNLQSAINKMAPQGERGKGTEPSGMASGKDMKDMKPEMRPEADPEMKMEMKQAPVHKEHRKD